MLGSSIFDTCIGERPVFKVCPASIAPLLNPLAPPYNKNGIDLGSLAASTEKNANPFIPVDTMFFMCVPIPDNTFAYHTPCATSAQLVPLMLAL